MVCTPAETESDVVIKEYPKPAFGSWGVITPKLKDFGIQIGESNTLSKLGYHKSNNLKLDFEFDQETELAVDCKQYTRA